MRCIYCGGPIDVERFQATGYTHCVAEPCVAAWRRGRVADSGLVLANQHKQGAVWMKRSDLPRNSMRRDGGL